MLPLSMGYIPTGLAFGSLSYLLGVKFYYTLGLSAFVYSGAVQSAFLGFWSAGFNIPALLLTAFLLNLRHSFYGAHLERKLGSLSTLAIIVIAPFLTDEVYGLAISNNSINREGTIRLALWAYLNWILASAAGFTLFSRIPSVYLEDLTVALSALFLGLFIPRVKGIDTSIVAVTSIVTAVLLRVANAPQSVFVVAIFAGFASGMIYLWKNGVRKTA